MFRILFLFVFNFIILGNIFATHLVGGNLAYEFVDTVNGAYRYKIKLNYYFDCGAGSNFIPEPNNPPNFGLPQNMTVGVYAHNNPNDIYPINNTDFPKYGLDDIPLVYNSTIQEYFTIEPDNPSNCSVGGDSVCIYTVLYTGIVDLLPINPANNQTTIGYFLIHEACCRNDGIDNIQDADASGMAFFAYVPPYGFKNDSPVFTDNPVPFLCVNDTSTFLNTAIDPDGDKLVFEFLAPLDGNHASGGGGGSNQTGSGGPGPGGGNLNWYPSPTYSLPIEKVTYNTNFSYNDPFGPGGDYSISASNGLTKYYSSSLGKFVVAIMIKEFRNGQLIGISTREVQLNVLPCPPNAAPNLNPAGGSTATIYSIEEGESLSFNFGFYDPNVPSDTILLNINGQLFDSLFTNPPATVGGYFDTLYSDPAIGIDTINTTFNWNTGCGQAQILPYIFSASVSDRGCPPKTTSFVYEVTVNKTDPPANIYGLLTDCENTEIVYKTDTNPNITSYSWDVSSNGTITQDYGDSVKIRWNSPGTGAVFLKAVNQYGCESDPISVNTTITPGPVVNAGNPVTICLGDSVLLSGTTTALPGYTSLWGPNTSISSPNTMTTYVQPNTTTKYYLSIQQGLSCAGIDTILVTVDVANIDAGSNITICKGDTAQLNAIGNGTNYVWSPNLNIISTNTISTQVWPTDTTTYFIQYTSLNNCINKDSVIVFVSPVPGSNSGFNPIPDIDLCLNDTVTINSPVTTDFYSWSPNYSISDSTIKSPVFNPVLNSTYYFTGTNSFGCFVKDTFQITIKQLPTVNAGNPSTLCIGDSVILNSNGNAASYSWDNGVVDGQAFEVLNTQNYILTATSANGCTNTDSVLITGLTAPATDAGSDINLCINDSIKLIGLGADNYSWSPSTSLSDPNVSDPFASPNSSITYILTGSLNNGCEKTDTINIDVNPLPVLTITNDTLICEGDTIEIEVFGATNFSWFNSNNISDVNISNPLVWPIATTTIKVSAYGPNTCLDTAEILINVNPKPIVDAGSDQNICFNDSTSVNVSGNASSYSWNNGISDNSPFLVVSTQDYIVTGINNISNCSNKDTLTVNVINLPIIDASQDDSLCIGDSVQISASGALNYIWSPNNNISNNTLNDPFVFPSVLTQYIVTGTDLNNCSNSDTVEISIKKSPIVSTSNNSSICLGDTITIFATGGVSYTWLNTDSISNINIFNPKVWPSTSSVYDVVVTGDNSCSDTAEFNISVNSLPVIDAGDDQTVCLGDTASLAVSGAVDYQWIPNLNISSSVGNNIQVWPLVSTDYIVRGIDNNFCISSDTVRVSLYDLPVAAAGPDLWLCPGTSLNLQANGGVTYNWFPDSTLIGSSSISNPLARPADDETYVVKVIDTNNCTSYDTLMLKVNSIVPTDAGNGSDTVTICLNSDVILGGNPTAPINSSYVWTPYLNLSDSISSNPTAQITTPIWYTVETTNDTCSGIDSVLINYFPDIIANTTIEDTSICNGENILLDVIGGNSYSWTPITNSNGDTIISNFSSQNPLVFPIVSTVFTVSIFDTNGCSIKDSSTVFIKPLPIVNLGQDLSYCLNDSIQISFPSIPGQSYLWSPNYLINNITVSNPIIYSLIDTVYILALTDSNSCTNLDSISVFINDLPNLDILGQDTSCSGDSLVLLGSGADSVYNWSPNQFISNNNIANPTIYPDSTSYYFMTGTNLNGCSNTDSILIKVLPLPIAFAGNDSSTCPGIPIQLNGSGGTDCQWINSISLSDSNICNPIASPNSITNYILKVTDLYGCINYDSVIIDISPSAIANAGDDIDTCANVPILLQASGGVSYLWYDSLYLNHPDVANPIAFIDNDTSFVVQVTDSNGCTDTDTVKISIFLANTSNDTLICEGDSYQANIYGDTPSAVFWLPVDGVSNPNIGNPILSPSQTTTYLVNFIDGARCVIIDTVKIEVPSIEATFDTTLTPRCKGIEVEYINTSDQELEFYWIFNNSDSAFEDEVIKIYNFNSEYIGTLFVNDSNGCISSLNNNGNALSFNDYFTITDPNVFSPNNDGQNDVFEIFMPDAIKECSELNIYNRWGQLQYFSSGYDLRWDGRNSSGSESPSGTYFYTLTVESNQFSGTLNLFR